MANKPTFWFLVPTHEVAADDFPTDAESYWQWICAQKQVDAWGPYDWTLRTYLELKGAGVECQMCHAMPDEGVVIAHRDFLPDYFRPGRRLLLVCIVADRQQPEFTGLHLFSQLYLVQNPREQMLTKPDPLWPTVYIPSWLQPGLIPRDPQRGQAFENIAYYGWPQNLVDPLNESKWRNELADMGLHWRIVSRSQWHDYTDTDAVVAIRSFSDKSFGYKPAAKLFNAWHAGVPCVAGPESSFRAERCNELDYLEAKSFDEAVAAMRRLRDDPALRRAMVENGNVRARETSCATMSHRWATILRDVVAPAWQRWRALSPAEQDQLLDRRAATVQTVAAAPQGQQA